MLNLNQTENETSQANGSVRASGSSRLSYLKALVD